MLYPKRTDIVIYEVMKVNGILGQEKIKTYAPDAWTELAASPNKIEYIANLALACMEKNISSVSMLPDETKKRFISHMVCNIEKIAFQYEKFYNDLYTNELRQEILAAIAKLEQSKTR